MQVNLVGELGELFGERWDLEVFSAAEALRAIAVQSSGFMEYLNASEELGVKFSIVTGKELRALATETELLELAEEVIYIAPIIEGEGGSPLIKGLLGVAMVGAAFLIPGGVTLFGAQLSSAIGLIGGSLIAQGISSLLSPPNKKSSDPANKESNVIDRAAQVVQQGARVPIGYGQLKVTDLIPISSGLIDERLISVQDDFAIYTRVTQVELPYQATALQEYTYYPSPKNFRQLNADFLQNNDIYSGIVVSKTPYNELRIKITFSTSPQGLNIKTAYALQKIRIHPAAEGFQGINLMRIFDSSYVELFGTLLNPATWNEFNLSALPIFNYPQDTFIFQFINQDGNIPYICVGELELYGSVGLQDELVNIKG